MMTAKKLDLNYPLLTSVQLEVAIDPKTKNKYSNPLLRECSSILASMGWSELPEEIQLCIALDLIGFRDEIQGLYSTTNEGVLSRRRSIYYWINQFLSGNCTSQTVTEALKVSYLKS